MFDYLKFDFKRDIDELYQKMIENIYHISRKHIEDVWFVLQNNNVDLFPVSHGNGVFAFLNGEAVSYLVCKNETLRVNSSPERCTKEISVFYPTQNKSLTEKFVQPVSRLLVDTYQEIECVNDLELADLYRGRLDGTRIWFTQTRHIKLVNENHVNGTVSVLNENHDQFVKRKLDYDSFALDGTGRGTFSRFVLVMVLKMSYLIMKTLK